MKENNTIPPVSTHLENFLERQKSLSTFEKRMEAGTPISEIDSVDVEKAYRKISRRIDKNREFVQFFNVLTRVAAVLSLPLLAFTIWSLFLKEESVVQPVAGLTWHELQTPAGMRSQVILPDGTRLWLNAESKIRYSIPFSREFRTIELTGEAFLEVTKNESSPFLVQAGKTTVQVTGTEFNLKSYPDEEQVEIALLEGSVKFSFKNTDNRQQYIDLKSGDHMVFRKDDETVQLKSTGLEKYIAWHRNILVLDETPMEEVARLLERWYGINVTLAGQELKKYRFTTTFENESLFQVLELLKLSSPIRIKYIPGKISRETRESERATIIISNK